MTDEVGPVLEASEVGHAIVRAISEANPGVTVVDRGAYLRVLVLGRCVVRADAIARILGRPFTLPGDLELVMPSFKGRIAIAEDEVVWS